jgi:soluble lytic murein transglycosylase-like protein
MTVMLMSSVIHLSRQKKDNIAAIGRLNETVARLEKNLSSYEKEKEKFDFYRFKENVFNLKYPNFSRVARIVFKKSREYGFSPYLVMAVIQVESNFDQYAVSTAGAYGLMQVNYSVWKDIYGIDFNRIYQKEYNIDLGLKILKRYYLKSSGNLLKALFRYNNGYKHNNHQYSARVIKTNFYVHGKEKEEDTGKAKNMSI